MADPQSLHHITNGNTLSSKLSTAGIPGTVSEWSDILHEGPVPEGQSDPELLETRARYGAMKGYGEYEELLTALRQWYDGVDTACDELVLWYEHDLFDQLNLISLLDRLSRRQPRPRVSLVSIDSFPGRPRFLGMGELRPEELAGLFPSRAEVTGPQYALAQAAWRAFRAPTREPLEALLCGDTSALPFLAPALRRHLEEFPSMANGLSRTEQQLLDLAGTRPMSIAETFKRLADLEQCFFLGDTSFWTVVIRLATSTPALLDVEIEEVSSRALPDGIIRITQTGRDVAAGRADRIALCGIDRWLGGVHLTAERPWRR
ncbi:MAG: hypothetical protein AB7K63_08315 [Vicinamibacterales bacterium]